MQSELKNIQKAFHGKLVGKAAMKHHVAEVLAEMSPDIISFVTKEVWFVTSFDDAWAFTFTGNDFENKYVIFLSDDLMHENVQQIRWTIAHEIGHVVLGHKNRFLEKFGREKTHEQERDADAFAEQFVTQPEQ